MAGSVSNDGIVQEVFRDVLQEPHTGGMFIDDSSHKFIALSETRKRFTERKSLVIVDEFTARC